MTDLESLMLSQPGGLDALAQTAEAPTAPKSPVDKPTAYASLSPEGYPVEAEQSVIGSMLISPRCVGSVLTRLKSEDFSPENAPLVAAIAKLFGERKRLDAVTVLEQMRRDGSYQEGTRRQVAELVELTPTAANVEEYVGIVERHARLRQIRALAAPLLSAKTLEEVPETLERMASALHQQERKDVENMADGVVALYNWIEDERPVEFLPTGLSQLDRGLQLEKGMYVVLAGNPSDGKTLLAVQMALTMAKKSKVGFFSCETSLQKLMLRIVSCYAGVSAAHLRKKKLSEQEIGTIVRANTTLSGLNLERIHSSGYTVADIRALTAARGYDVIFVDYLQIIRPDNPRDPDVRQLQQISRQLHELAQSIGVLVVALSQYSWESSKQGRTPRVCDLKGASEIEQNADAILLLSAAGLSKSGDNWETAVDQSQLPEGAELRLLQIAKNKDGERGSWLHLLLWGEFQRMEPYRPVVEREPEEPEWIQGEIEELGELP